MDNIKNVDAREVAKDANVRYWASVSNAVSRAVDLIKDLGLNVEDHIEPFREVTGGRPRENFKMSNLATFFVLAYLDSVMTDRASLIKEYSSEVGGV